MVPYPGGLNLASGSLVLCHLQGPEAVSGWPPNPPTGVCQACASLTDQVCPQALGSVRALRLHPEETAHLAQSPWQLPGAVALDFFLGPGHAPAGDLSPLGHSERSRWLGLLSSWPVSCKG